MPTREIRAGRQKSKQIRRRDPTAVRLLAVRVALGYDNQAEYAKRAGLSQNRYNQYETGERRITVDAAIKLKKTYRISLDWIYAGDHNGLPQSLWSALSADPAARAS